MNALGNMIKNHGVVSTYAVGATIGALAYGTTCAIYGRKETDEKIGKLWNGKTAWQTANPGWSKAIKWTAAVVVVGATAYFGGWKSAVESLWTKFFGAAAAPELSVPSDTITIDVNRTYPSSSYVPPAAENIA